MSFVPTFSNGVASATLDDNNVTVEIHRGYLSVYDNSTGSDACIFRYRLDEDRFQMGAIFQKFGLEFETRVVSALQHNPLLHGLGALYAMLMEVYVPCFKN